MEQFKSSRSQSWKPSETVTLLMLIAIMPAIPGLYGCNRTPAESGVYAVTYEAQQLPHLTLTDQYNHQVTLASSTSSTPVAPDPANWKLNT
jgi:hypothetical protein